MTLEHQIAAEDPRTISLARTLTELGIADPRDWQHNPSSYVLQTLSRWIAQHGGDVVREQFALDVTLRNHPGSYGSEDVDPARLYLAVEAASAGYVVLGPTLDLLQPVHPQLPVTFYRLVIDAVRRGLPVYDYLDALERVEQWKEWAEQEDSADPYELPDVEGCIPPAMKQKGLSRKELCALKSKLKDEGARRLVRATLDLDSLSRRLARPEISEASREALMDSNPALPALLVSFRHQDAIAGVFDEESQIWLEAEPEPAFLAEIHPVNAASVRQAFRALAILTETLAAASRLIGLLPGNQEER